MDEIRNPLKMLQRRRARFPAEFSMAPKKDQFFLWTTFAAAWGATGSGREGAFESRTRRDQPRLLPSW